MRDPFWNTNYLDFLIAFPMLGMEAKRGVVRIGGSLTARYADGVLVIGGVTVVEPSLVGGDDAALVRLTAIKVLLNAGATPITEPPSSQVDLSKNPYRFHATREATLSALRVLESIYDTATMRLDFDETVQEIAANHYRSLHHALWLKVYQDGSKEAMTVGPVGQGDVMAEVLSSLVNTSIIRFEP